MMLQARCKVRIAVFLLVVLMAGCKLGPNFRTPDAPKLSRYNPGPLLTKTVSAPSPAGKSQRMQYNQDISSSWWTIFHSKELNALIEQGLKYNTTIEMSQANLRNARANLLAVVGPKLFPNATTQFSGNRERVSLIAAGVNLTPVPGQTSPFVIKNQYDLYNASIGVSYDLDLFGGTRRQLEALRAAIDYQLFELEATYLTLTSNIVTTAITVASLQAQISATEKLIECQKKWLSLMKSNFKLGHVSLFEVLNGEDRLRKSEATLPSLKKNLSKKYNALSVLIGSFPGESHLPYLTLNNLHLPAQLPVSLPSRLVRQRPDIRSAESLLHKASAEIGVATANLFPNFNLAGNYGWYSTALSSLFNPVNSVWNYGGQVVHSLFKGGAMWAKRKVAIANYEYACAKYKNVVLKAFQNVADVLRALEFDAELLQVRANDKKNVHERLKLIENQYKLGKVNYLTLLSTKEHYLRVHLKVVQAEASRFNDTAALFQALGGGWWNRGCCK